MVVPGDLNANIMSSLVFTVPCVLVPVCSSLKAWFHPLYRAEYLEKRVDLYSLQTESYRFYFL